MSTNINITVGDNALLDRAKQQQAANRQAQLNRENSTRLEAQATDERTKALAAEGKDANGNPLYGVPFTQPQIDRRPAANRQGDALPYFYWQTRTDPQTGAVVYEFISGDGAASGTYMYPTPSLGSALLSPLSPVAQTIPVDSSWSISNPNSLVSTEAQLVTNVLGSTGTDPNNPIDRLYSTTQTYQVDRDVSTFTVRREFIFPLGDDTCLFAAYRNETAKISRRTFYVSTLRTFSYLSGINSPRALLEEEIQAATYTNTDEVTITNAVDIACFRIGHKVCTRVQPSAVLTSALAQLVPAVVTETTTYTSFLPTCTAPSCVNFPPSGEITVDATILVPLNAEDYGVQDGMPRNLGYGVSYQGSVPDRQGSPAAWFALGDKANDKVFSVAQHINAQTPLVPVSGKSFVSLFTPSKYIGLPIEVRGPLSDFNPVFDLSVPSSLRPFKYSSSEYMSGNTILENYPYTLPAWTLSAIKIPSSNAVNPTPSLSWNRSFIYDWGQRGFCAQQKGLYGITYTPFTP